MILDRFGDPRQAGFRIDQNVNVMDIGTHARNGYKPSCRSP
jgi:hypothetical protein